MVNVNNQLSTPLTLPPSSDQTGRAGIPSGADKDPYQSAVNGVPKSYCIDSGSAINETSSVDKPTAADTLAETGASDTVKTLIENLKALMSLLAKLLEMIRGMRPTSGNGCGTTQTPPTTGTGDNGTPPTTGSEGPTTTDNGEETSGGTLTISDQLFNTVNKSETGAALLSMAQKNNVKIEITDDVMEGASGVTYIDGDNIDIKVKPGDLEQMTETLGHELVHAATAGDGNSITEEVYASVIGEKVSTEAGVNDHPRSVGNIENAVRAEEVYNDLPEDNGVLQDLKSIGITV